MKSETKTEGVVIELNGKYWGIVYQDAHDGTAYDWGELAKATLQDPKWCKKPTDITYGSSPDVKKLALARLVPATKTVIIEAGEQRNVQSSTYAIGPGNTYQQAWAAMLAGHQARMPDWHPEMRWIFERTAQELLIVWGDTLEDWQRTGQIVCPTGNHQLFQNWEVLPIIDADPPTV